VCSLLGSHCSLQVCIQCDLQANNPISRTTQFLDRQWQVAYYPGFTCTKLITDSKSDSARQQILPCSDGVALCILLCGTACPGIQQGLRPQSLSGPESKVDRFAWPTIGRPMHHTEKREPNSREVVRVGRGGPKQEGLPGICFRRLPWTVDEVNRELLASRVGDALGSGWRSTT
jgi:hypothetical protein